MDIIVYILVFINIVAFIFVGIDKNKAKKRVWRIPERTFFWFALIGGCPGIYTGMLLFRHKTKHWYFMYGIPFIFILQIVLIFLINYLL